MRSVSYEAHSRACAGLVASTARGHKLPRTPQKRGAGWPWPSPTYDAPSETRRASRNPDMPATPVRTVECDPPTISLASGRMVLKTMAPIIPPHTPSMKAWATCVPHSSCTAGSKASEPRKAHQAVMAMTASHSVMTRPLPYPLRTSVFEPASASGKLASKRATTKATREESSSPSSSCSSLYMIPRTNASGMASMKQPTQIMMAASRSDSLLVAWRSSGRGLASFLGVSCHGGDSGVSGGAASSGHSSPPPAAASAASAAGAGVGVAGVASSGGSENVRSPGPPPATSALASAPPSAPSADGSGGACSTSTMRL
mmetsp:Transcript_13958/g.44845  ORF Transcript_13958/g.44845 Transcript_13958/m.44845 type:complete len:315 (+) Transcript_13958:545-1489(+)